MKESRTILVNPNIATIQTSDYLADQIYFLPINATSWSGSSRRNGRTASCSVSADRLPSIAVWTSSATACSGDGVRILGTPIQAIRETEDRDLFVKKLARSQSRSPKRGCYFGRGGSHNCLTRSAIR